MTDINNPHDKFFKESMKTKAIARSFLQAHVPESIQKRINFDSLQPTDQEYIETDMKASYSDVVYQCEIDNKPAFLYFLIEHQSTPDELLAFRLLYYIFQLMKRHLDQAHDQLPIVLPMCIYHGNKSPYPYSTDILDCFDDPELAEQLLFQPFKLIDLTQMTLTEFQEHGAAGLMEVLLQHHNEKQLRRLLQNLIETQLWHQGIYEAKRDDYIDLVLNYILNTYDDEYYNQDIIIEELAQADPNNRKYIMSIAERLQQKGEQKGLQKGKQEGRQEGRQEGMRQTAYRMLQDGMLDETVKRYTGLADEDIKQLKRNLDSSS